MGFWDGINSAYGAIDKKIGGVLPGGAERSDFAKKVMAVPGAVSIAAEESLPALLGGALGKDRTDRDINPQLAEAIKSTAEKAKVAGKSKFGYHDFDSTTVGGLAARLTMGDVAMNEMEFDDEGNATRIVQKFDTNKTPQEAMSELSLNPKTWYKPFEAALASVQGKGLTTHDVELSKKDDYDLGNIVSTAFGKDGTRMAGGADITVDGTVPTTEANPAMSYAVQAGDTLSSIAAANNTTVDEIARANNIADVNMINVGRKLKL